MLTASSSQDSRPENRGPHSGPILVGVIPGQPAIVVVRAAELAARLGVDLVCAYVDTSTYEDVRDDEKPVLLPIDPDGDYDYIAKTAGEIQAHLAQALQGSGVAWSFRYLPGEPARALAETADTLDAMMIVIGTREPGLAHRLEEIMAGSVAVHLAYHQHRPVLVVPLNPQLSAEQR